MSAQEDKQLQILRYIYETVSAHGFPPTVREICSEVQLSSTSTVHGHLARLERRGYIEKDATKPRAIEVTPAGMAAIGVSDKIPVVGQVAAGEPILAEENIEDYFPIPPSLEHKGKLFMLKVSGESMINIGINDGDYVIVKEQQQAENNEIVVAQVAETETGATVKRLKKDGPMVQLIPENDQMSPFIYPANQVTILGKVVGLYRDMD